MKIAIVTDSNSGIFERQARKMGVHVVPMPFSVDGRWLYEGVQLTAADFYKAQAAGSDITTSMPSPAEVAELWDRLLQENDQLVYIPMSSALSGSCAAAAALAADYGGRVQVVDNKRISVTQMQAVLDAKRLAKRGMDAAAIKKQLELHALDASIYITCSDLKYLKKGGRITPAAAAIGTVLNIKPLLWGDATGHIVACGKYRGRKKVMEAIAQMYRTRAIHPETQRVAITHGDCPEEAERLADMVRDICPPKELIICPHEPFTGAHVGPGMLALFFFGQSR